MSAIMAFSMQAMGADNPKNQFNPVQTGVTDGIYTEITKGLSEGDSVAVGFKMQLPADGMEEEMGGEQSPFMPTPPGGNKKK